MSRRPRLVTDPSGMDWKVQIVWQPRWDALAGRFGGWRRKRQGKRSEFDGLDWVDVPYTNSGSSSGGGFIDDLGDDLAVAVLVIVAAVVVGALFWWLLLPLLLVLIDGLVLVALLVAGTVARVALGRPWTIRVTPRRGAGFEENVHGWGNARRRRQQLEDSVRSGALPDGRERINLH